MKFSTCLLLGVVATTAAHVDAQDSNSTDCPSSFNCTDVFEPVCASDGITYWNECWLDVADCESADGITKAQDGGCNTTGSAASLAADNGSPMESGGTADCSDVCTLIYKPVCGSDGVTYGNNCTLSIAQCESSGAITQVSEGECPGQTNCKDVCPMIYQPVCGSDGATYGNGCLLGVAQCKSGGAITYASDGECPSPPTENTCEKLCIEIYKPVCGSDGVTYSNECFLSIAACTDSSITQVGKGACGGSQYPHESC